MQLDGNESTIVSRKWRISGPRWQGWRNRKPSFAHLKAVFPRRQHILARFRQAEEPEEAEAEAEEEEADLERKWNRGDATIVEAWTTIAETVINPCNVSHAEGRVT